MLVSPPVRRLPTGPRPRRLAGAALAALLLAGLSLLPPRPAAPTPALAAGPTVTVSGSPAGGALATQLSTNLVSPGVLDQAPGGRDRLAALAPPLVRLHAGSDTGSPTALPAGDRQGNWDFAPLDAMAAAVRAYGAQPVLNVRYAPNWMWTCSAPFDQGSAGVGGLRDPSFGEFGDYLARLVGWYNKGGFTDEQGVFHSSGHQGWVRFWELWNEPNLSDETPCHPSGGGAALSPEQYVAMWNAVVPKMLAVDPSLQLVGPVVADPSPNYVTAVMGQAARPPDVLSYHAYGGYLNTETDQALFDSAPGMAAGVDPSWGRPTWVTELNVSSAVQNDPSGRPAAPFGVAWGASAFRGLALAGAALVHQYEFIAEPQFGLVDPATGAPRLPYWRDLLLKRGFPTGSSLLSSSSSSTGVEALAARRPDGKLSVLVINRQVAAPGDLGGAGVPTTVTVHLQGLAPSSARLQVLDSTTNPAQEPPTRSLAAASDLQVPLAGYGMALLDLDATAAGQTPTPTPTPQPRTTTVTFDALPGNDGPLNGQYPSGVIDWGTGVWYVSGPWGQLTTNSVYFNQLSGSFTFLTPRQLLQLDVYNGDTTATTVTLTCNGSANSQAQASVAAGTVGTIKTGWSGPCTGVTVASDAASSFTNLVLQ